MLSMRMPKSGKVQPIKSQLHKVYLIKDYHIDSIVYVNF